MVVAPDDGLPDTFLNDTWRVYAHHPSNADWTHKSYTPVGIVASVGDFWTVWNSCVACVDRTMLFFMREHVFPSWDDPACIEGAIASVIVDAGQATAVFRDIVQRALGETLVAGAAAWTDINGVSIGPKNGFCVVKVWLAKRDATANHLKLPPVVDASKVRFQPCRAHIAGARPATSHCPIGA